MPRTAYLNGRYLPLADARVPVTDRGLLFADAIYEVTTVIGGRPVDMAAHLDRLERSAREIGLTVPASRDELAAIHAELIARDRIDEGVVYLQLTRGDAGDRDFVAAPGLAPTLILFTQAKPIVDTPLAARGMAVMTVADLRWRRRDIKTVGLLAQALAKREAQTAGADDAWLVEDGLVTEGASSTAWIVTRDGRIVTRGDSHATLPGITALAVSALAAETGLSIDRRAFSVAEAQGAAEAFATAATLLVMPVVSIDGARVGDGGPGAIASRLRELYVGFAKGTA